MKRIVFIISLFTGGVAISLPALSLQTNLAQASSAQTSSVISLEQAISLAQQNDPWLHGSELRQKAADHLSIAAGTWEDPKVSIGMMNLPTNSWAFNQEAMTQFNIGVSQVFPRGNSLAIKESQLKTEASRFALLREDRKAKIETMVSELWLDAYLAQQTIALIESDRTLFEQIAEVAKASYASAVGKTRQQDVIRADLEIIQLEDRLMAQRQSLESTIAQLNEWFHLYSGENAHLAFNFDSQPLAFSVTKTLPSITLRNPLIIDSSRYARNSMAETLASHPAIKAIEIKRKVSEKEVELTKQQYKPQWGVNASYGYRDDMPSGQSRADFFSVGVSFDVPLFTGDRQDNEVSASVAESEAVRTERILLTKQMLSEVEKEIRQLVRLRQRHAIYQQQLLQQTQEQAEASLTAYTNDDGDFAEVVRARIAVLNAQISALRIEVDGLKTVARLNYFLAGSSGEEVNNTQSQTAEGADAQMGEK